MRANLQPVYFFIYLFFLPLKADEFLLMEDLGTRRENQLRVSSGRLFYSARDERIVALSRVECVSVCLNVFEWQPGDELRSTPPVCGMMLLGLRDEGGRRNRSLPCEDCQEI